jgi:hypothetical protein
MVIKFTGYKNTLISGLGNTNNENGARARGTHDENKKAVAIICDGFS